MRQKPAPHNIIAIIPARGGSKSIPRKNIRMFCGKPLLQYSIDAGLQSKFISDVFVSTDDQAIAEIASGFGARVIDRPAEFATDTASTFSVIRHAWEVLNHPEIIVTLQPTSPLRTPQHIDEAISLLADDVETIVGVCASHRYHWRVEGQCGMPEFTSRLPRQNMSKQYFENGSIYVTRQSVFLRNDSKLGMGISSVGKVVLYEMDPMFSIEIDSEQDFRVLETIFNIDNS